SNSDIIVEPAELELLPSAHVAGFRADVDRAVAHPRTRGHQRPEGGGVLAAGGVVQIGQAQIVAVLVREHAYAAVLRLDGVLADPVVAVTDLQAAEHIKVGTGGAGPVLEGVPAVAPDSPVIAFGRAGFV